MAASSVVYGRALQFARDLVRTVVVLASDLRRIQNTSERKRSVDRQSRNQITGSGTLQRDGPRRLNANRP